MSAVTMTAPATSYKSAGDLVPGDVYVERRPSFRKQSKPYRVVAIRSGPTSTVIEVAVMCVATGRKGTFNLFRVNRVDLVA